MFKGHPKGLFAAAIANMGERFGFYTMMAILSLFLMSKFGLDSTQAGWIYSVFYFSIYILALVGGLIADIKKNYKGIIFIGLILMTLGYALMSIPTETPVKNLTLSLSMSCFALFIIAFGNGLFKGNLQALIGKMYDKPEYMKMRDSGFSLFYMFINVGAIFAPFTAVGIRNWWLGHNGLKYSADLPELCHEQLAGTLSPDAAHRFAELAQKVNGTLPTDLNVFADRYLNVFVTGFHYAFAIAIVAMIISAVVYITNKQKFPDSQSENIVKETLSKEEVIMGAAEIRQRIFALMAVMAVVIFFWFSFHQNGLTLTFFAKDYTLLPEIHPFSIFGSDYSVKLSAELFQSMNPFFVVFLTPLVIAFFGFLRARGIEPSTHKKIMFGMGIAATAYVVMSLGSLHLPLLSEVKEMGGLGDNMRVTPFLLIGVYFILTVAELFISPLGLSFVSKVAPPQYSGIMQGAWLGATALGNQLLVIGTMMYQNIPLWITWSVFAVVCGSSMLIMLGMLKWLERITK